ncbi:MAG: PHP domain-containing protein, partial [Gammaproteobacteria bacterium]|nr:PHP domain-containing protein [Gammaproteobacteria bacterium]
MKLRTGFSFRHSIGHLPDVIPRLQEIGWETAPISDRNSTFGFTKYTKLAQKAGLRTIYGVELAVATRIGEDKPVTDFWAFFATKSLRSLHELVGLATDSAEREPTLTYV